MEVFLHDPLYRWALSPLQASKIQGGEGGVFGIGDNNFGGNNNNNATNVTSVTNVEAERTLLRVNLKLMGHEYGDAFTVEGKRKKKDHCKEECLIRQIENFFFFFFQVKSIN